jgi:hypothetical protein
MAFLAGLIGELGTGAAAGEAATAGTAAATEGAGATEALNAEQFTGAGAGAGKKEKPTEIPGVPGTDNINVGKGLVEGASSIKGALTNDYGSPSLGDVGDRLRNLNSNQFG